MAWGCRSTNSIARRSTPCQAASVRGSSNHVLSEVLRAGRASTAGLSPLNTPDSILMCYRKRPRRGMATHYSLGFLLQHPKRYIADSEFAIRAL